MSEADIALADAPETDEDRQERRLADLPVVYRRNDERMALELVMLPADGDPWAVIQGYGYTSEQAHAVLASPAFSALVAAARRDVDEEGVGFVTKARLQAEELLQYSYDMATDVLVASSVRADLIKWTAAVAGWGPKKDGDAKGAGGGFTLNIAFPQPQQVPALTQGITIEAEQ